MDYMVLLHLSHIKDLLINGIIIQLKALFINYNHLVKHLIFN